MNIQPETKPCECGKLMILRGTGHILTSYPPQYPQVWYCGGCDRTEKGPTLQGRLPPSFMDDWRQANGLSPHFTPD